MKLLFASVSMVLALGISKLSPSSAAPPPDLTATTSTTSAPEFEGGEPDPMACYFIWSCYETGDSYANRATCNAACESACTSEPVCSPGCPCLR